MTDSGNVISAPTVSIIIPFFNLEKEAARCLDSVLAQTYENFEAVCVNDGSSDGTGGILDTYQAKDNRIRVIHKSNGGLSDARNTGVAAACGTYITFIDGDDIVIPHYLETLIAAMEGKLDRLVIANCKPILEGKFEVLTDIAPVPEGKMLSKETVCRLLLVKGLPSLAQSKLYVREHYLSHPFPVGVRYEEIRTIGKLVASAEEISVADAPIYGYVIREGSIVRASNATEQQGMEYVEAIQIALNDFQVMGYNLNDELAFFKAIMFTRVHDFSKRISDSVGAKAVEREAKKAVAEAFRGAMRCKNASKSQKARICLYRLCPAIYDSVFAFYNKKIKGVG